MSATPTSTDFGEYFQQDLNGVADGEDSDNLVNIVRCIYNVNTIPRRNVLTLAEGKRFSIYGYTSTKYSWG